MSAWPHPSFFWYDNDFLDFYFEKSVPTYRWYSYHVVSFTELREIILEMSCTHIGLYNTPEKYEYTGKNYL